MLVRVVHLHRRIARLVQQLRQRRVRRNLVLLDGRAGLRMNTVHPRARQVMQDQQAAQRVQRPPDFAQCPRRIIEVREAVVAEDQVKVVGGQRQRLGIALDEAGLRAAWACHLQHGARQIKREELRPWRELAHARQQHTRARANLQHAPRRLKIRREGRSKTAQTLAQVGGHTCIPSGGVGFKVGAGLRGCHGGRLSAAANPAHHFASPAARWQLAGWGIVSLHTSPGLFVRFFRESRHFRAISDLAYTNQAYHSRKGLLMSLLRRIDKVEPPDSNKILRLLLERMHKSGALLNEIKNLSMTSSLSITPAQFQLIRDDPVGFLLGNLPQAPGRTGPLGTQTMNAVGTSDELRAQVRRMLAEYDWPAGASGHRGRAQEAVENALRRAEESRSQRLPAAERQSFIDSLLGDILGFGSLGPLLNNPAATEIIVYSPQNIWARINGELSQQPLELSAENVITALNRLLSPVGQNLSRAQPSVSVRVPLNDGFLHVIAAIPPATPNGPIATLRKSQTLPTGDDLLRTGVLDADSDEFLHLCVRARLNILISGKPNHPGKTVLLNALAAFIPKANRIVTIEQQAALKLAQPQVIRLQMPPFNEAGAANSLEFAQLIETGRALGADNTLIDEIHGPDAGAALDLMAQQRGVIACISSPSPREALRRLEVLVQRSGTHLPIQSLRENILNSVDVIVQLERSSIDPIITQIAQITELRDEGYTLDDLYEIEGVTRRDGQPVRKRLRDTGLIPKFLKVFWEAEISPSRAIAQYLHRMKTREAAHKKTTPP